MGGTEIAMVLASALLHAAWSVSIKGARDPLAFNFAQTVAQLGICMALLPFLSLRDVPAGAWWLLAGAGLAHGLYFWFLGRSFQTAELTLAYPIIRSTPAFLPLAAVPLLHERLSLPGAAGIAVVVGGIWAIQAEGGLRGALRAPGIGYAWLTLGTGVAYSLADKSGVTALQAGGGAGALPPSLAWFCLTGFAMTAVFWPIAWRGIPRAALAHAVRREAGRAALTALASLAGYGLVLEAYRTAPVSYVVAVRQTSVLFTAGIAILLLGERPSGRRLFGAAATVAGVALIAWGG